MTFGNLAYSLDIVAEIRGDEDSVIQGDRRLSWSQVERRARNISAWMIECGATHQGKVAVYTYNHPAYMESVYAAFKASLVPLNVNYRYQAQELRYLLDNSDAEIVVVHEDFAPLLEEVLPDLPQVVGVLVVEESGEYDKSSIPNSASYEATAETDRPAPDVERSPDDLLFVYTGGTTGMPKGVMWRQADIFTRFGGGGIGATPETEEAYRAFVKEPGMRYRSLISPPLMHGTGWFQAMIAWLGGGVVVVLENAKKFDPAELWRTVGAEKINSITIVGDPFAVPMAKELDEHGDAYDLSSKQRLLAHHSGLVLADAFGSSEAVGLGLSLTTAAGSVQTGKFELSDSTKLFNADFELIETKPGARGLVGVGGLQPLGYYKDPEATAKTFVECEAGRFSVPGDWAEVNEDGHTLTLLGRGSVCINTGGEKVFPEEVEEVIKRFEGVKDAVVVGVPDERWGEAITAVVSSHEGELDGAAIIEHVKGSLAGYKAPKHVVQVPEVYRSPAGKPDFKRTRQTAMEELGLAG
ncbi:MAG: AMP-binding protein [Deltaproteobacteria bacterium]|nr:AMP-binding protein [Deltaproteobacteria bacterium]